MKKKLLIALGVAAIATLSAKTTVAFLDSQTEKIVNTMTMGEVAIEQLEYERIVDKNGKWISTGEKDKYNYTPDELQPFTQDKQLLPVVMVDGKIKWDDRNGSEDSSGEKSHQQSWGQVGASGSNQLFDDSVRNAIDKFVFVKNTGDTDAYVRTWVAFEQGNVEAERFSDIIMTNTNKDHWSWETVAGDVEIEGNKYLIRVATYLSKSSNPNGILEAGTISYPSLLQLYMKSTATNEDVKAIDGNANGKYDVLVLSQAVQAKGFDNYETGLENATNALNAAFGEEHPFN